MSEKLPLIYSLIPKVMADVGPIGKNGKNEYDGYKFRKIEDVYNHLNPALTKHGVFYVPEVLEAIETEGESSKGTRMVRTRLKVRYRIYASDGSFVESIVWGEAMDRSDKSYNKALTFAQKYMLIQMFCIPIEDIDDGDKESPEIKSVTTNAPALEEKKILKLAKKGAPAPETKNTKPGGYIIKDGKYKGKNISDINSEELSEYIQTINEALKEYGGEKPTWFRELEQLGE